MGQNFTLLMATLDKKRFNLQNESPDPPQVNFYSPFSAQNWPKMDSMD